MDKRLLIGFHNKDNAEATTIVAGHKGYESVAVENLDQLMAEARTHQYQRVIMDVNFGFPNTANILPAVQVYEILKPRIESGLTKFLAISGNSEAVRLAKERGIPAESKGRADLPSFLD